MSVTGTADTGAATGEDTMTGPAAALAHTGVITIERPADAPSGPDDIIHYHYMDRNEHLCGGPCGLGTNVDWEETFGPDDKYCQPCLRENLRQEGLL